MKDKSNRFETLEGFSHVLGQPSVVEAFRTRIRKRRHDTTLLLHGPTGVGKRTLARLYGKAVLCAQPSADASACGCCEACRMFEDEHPAYIELAASKDFGPSFARDILDRASRSLFGGRVVISIRGVAALAPSVFDLLLKGLERDRHQFDNTWTFILLADDLAGVRAAGRSRSHLYKVRPLLTEDARTLTAVKARQFQLDWSDDVVRLVAMASKGLPGEIERAAINADKAQAQSYHDVHTLLDAGWVSSVGEYWLSLIEAKRRPDAADLACPVPDLRRQIEHMRLFLAALSAPAMLADRTDMVPTGVPFPEGGLHILAAVAEALRVRAASTGVENTALWHRLAALWSRPDHTTFEGYVTAGRRSWEIIHDS